MYLTDFHVHTQYSDGLLSLSEVVDMYGERGFGAIAVTDHLCEEGTFFGGVARLLKRTLTPQNAGAYFDDLKDEAARAWDKYQMVLIPGVELTKNALSRHESAHVLALGVDQVIRAELDAPDAAKAIRAAGGLAIAAHPVNTRKFEPQTYGLWHRREELAETFDAWEVASGPHIFQEVAATKLPKIANSDLHHKGQLRSWKTVLDCERHPEAILRAIRRQEVSFRFYNG